MDLQDAIELINPALSLSTAQSTWADLGSGDGLFTRALAMLLGPGSTIHAVDRSRYEIESSLNGNTIVFHQLDFIKDIFPFARLDGILMTNSLHFVRDKASLLTKLSDALRPMGLLIVIEYEMEKGNAWVPYPIPYAALEAHLADRGFLNISRIGERPSIYAGRKMYVCAAVSGRV